MEDEANLPNGFVNPWKIKNIGKFSYKINLLSKVNILE